MKLILVPQLLRRRRIPSLKRKRLAMAVLTIPPILLLLLATGCSLFQRDVSSGISHETDLQEDVIASNGSGISNLDKLDEFIERGSGSQRVVQYTIEGNPVYTDLRYDGGRLELRYDTTEDAFGSREVTTYACDELVRTEAEHLLKYTLKGCGEEPEDRVLLTIDFDVARQDKFEFVLKYGVNHRNVIDTGRQTLVKDMMNGTTVEVSDYFLPRADRQSIYRKLVLANYLEEKQLSTSCNRKPYASYELTVMINAAEHQYAWSECDTSRDGGAMMEVADYIIGLVEAGDSFQQLPAATGGYK